mmetsp:Transcript_62718/g.149722  ORF Transcript_62718/g.149722 Transcript_62718/m.149722 type:complete len:233 (-) Transcript_62718:646-1344(-)
MGRHLRERHGLGPLNRTVLVARHAHALRLGLPHHCPLLGRGLLQWGFLLKLHVPLRLSGHHLAVFHLARALAGQHAAGHGPRHRGGAAGHHLGRRQQAHHIALVGGQRPEAPGLVPGTGRGVHGHPELRAARAEAEPVPGIHGTGHLLLKAPQGVRNGAEAPDPVVLVEDQRRAQGRAEQLLQHLPHGEARPQLRRFLDGRHDVRHGGAEAQVLPHAHGPSGLRQALGHVQC